jgi:hypothetical protein
VLCILDVAGKRELQILLLEGMAAPSPQPSQRVADLAQLIGTRILQSFVLVQNRKGIIVQKLHA